MAPTLDAVAWPVRSDRLLLRPATPEDLATWEIRRGPVVSEWLTGAPATFEHYRERFLAPERLATSVVIVLARDGTVIGDLMIAIGDAWSQAEVAEDAAGVQAELGWTLHPDQQGHGYATEAVATAISIRFEDLGLPRVGAGCFAANQASWRLMERLGMRRETSTRKDSLHRSLGWLDGLGYALLAEEWTGQAPRLPS